MAKIKRLNEAIEIGVSFREIFDICKAYETLSDKLVPLVVEKYNKESSERFRNFDPVNLEDCMIDRMEVVENGNIYIEFLDQNGNDFNVTLTEGDIA